MAYFMHSLYEYVKDAVTAIICASSGERIEIETEINIIQPWSLKGLNRLATHFKPSVQIISGYKYFPVKESVSLSGRKRT